MAEYGVVFKRLWTPGSRFMQLTEDAQRLVLYAFSSPDSNIIGLYRFKFRQLGFDWRWSDQRIRKALSGAESHGFIEYDDNTDVVLVHGWFDGEPPAHKIKNPNQVKRALSEISELPRTPLILSLINEIADGCSGMTADYLQVVVDRLRQRLPEQLPKQTQVCLGTKLDSVSETNSSLFGKPEPVPEPVPVSEPEERKSARPPDLSTSGESEAVQQFKRYVRDHWPKITELLGMVHFGELVDPQSPKSRVEYLSYHVIQGTILAYLQTDSDEALESLLERDRGDWGRYIRRWLNRDLKAKRAGGPYPSAYTMQMTAQEERQHCARKERRGDVTSGDFSPIGGTTAASDEDLECADGWAVAQALGWDGGPPTAEEPPTPEQLRRSQLAKDYAFRHCRQTGEQPTDEGRETYIREHWDDETESLVNHG